MSEYLQQGDWFVLTDAKSGYHHIRMPSYSKTGCRSALHTRMTSSGVGDCRVRQDHLALVVIGCGNMAQDLQHHVDVYHLVLGHAMLCMGGSVQITTAHVNAAHWQHSQLPVDIDC